MRSRPPPDPGPVDPQAPAPPPGGAGEGAWDPQGPLATVMSVGGGRRVMAVDAAAEALGLAPGLTLKAARARAPDLAAAPHDPVEDAAVQRRMLAACRRFTPRPGDRRAGRPAAGRDRLRPPARGRAGAGGGGGGAVLPAPASPCAGGWPTRPTSPPPWPASPWPRRRGAWSRSPARARRSPPPCRWRRWACRPTMWRPCAAWACDGWPTCWRVRAERCRRRWTGVWARGWTPCRACAPRRWPPSWSRHATWPSGG